MEATQDGGEVKKSPQGAEWRDERYGRPVNLEQAGLKRAGMVRRGNTVDSGLQRRF